MISKLKKDPRSFDRLYCQLQRAIIMAYEESGKYSIRFRNTSNPVKTETFPLKLIDTGYPKGMF